MDTCKFCPAPRATSTVAASRYRMCEEHYRLYALEHVHRTHQRTRDKVIALYGGCCKHCGYTDRRALQLDHIEGQGNEHRRKLGHAGLSMYRLALKEPDRFQLLCANCNWIKRAVAGEHAGTIRGDSPDFMAA